MTSEMTAVAVAPIVVAPIQVGTKCARPECSAHFEKGTGFVPDFGRLYRAIRGTGVDLSSPLTREEVLGRELCYKCSRLAAFKTFRTQNTLSAMERIDSENEAYAEQRREQQLAYADMRNSHPKSPVNHIAEAAERARRQAVTHHKRGKRLPAAERRRLAETRASRPFAAVKEAKGGKKKDSGKNGKKGRK
ncbi:MAG: hypothetical protein KBC02_02450 [Candidatus Pacebacteria bacterium]|nr:hypothetical protein [Candidatus Paceibacterota bacterium]